MYKTAVAVIAAVGVTVGIALWMGSSPPPAPVPKPAVTQVSELIELVKSGQSPERITRSLEHFNYHAAAPLREAAEQTKDPAARQRLEQLACRLARPNWRLNLAQAQAEAAEKQQLMLVFSTIGSPSGFA